MFDFASQDEQSDIVKYLSWQIEQHDLQLDALREMIQQEASRDVSESDFDGFLAERVNFFLEDYKRVRAQRDRLNRERLRLTGDLDFEGSNYLLR